MASAPRMLLLIDENVPDSVAEFFASRGHDVRFVRDVLPAGSPDPLIATLGHRLSAVVVTWDRDFDKLVRRVPEGSRAAFRRLGRITFSCKYVNGRARIEKWIRTVELLYEQALEQPDVRMMAEIQEQGYKAW